MYQQTRKDFDKKFLSEGLLSSRICQPTYLIHDYFLSEIAVKIIELKTNRMRMLCCTLEWVMS
jgi:pre-mRNA-splicing helicase BRR2